MKKEKYDGLNITKKDNGHVFTSYRIDEALEQENIRNVFLNGQLFVEMLCDELISIYFTNVKNPQFTILKHFLKSRDVDFFTKVSLMKELEYFEGMSRKKWVDAKIITSLIAIGSVRNTFQHNLSYDDALKSLTSGAKFSFLNKPLSTYNGVDDLVRDFKTETYEIYDKLHKLCRDILEWIKKSVSSDNV